MLTSEEYEYLEKLKKRNISNDFNNQTEPLNGPMSAEESQLRNSIAKKCNVCLPELALAQLCGVLPTEEMRNNNFRNAMEAIDKLEWSLLLKSMQHAEA